MKRIFLSVFAIVLSFGAFAQQTPAPKDTLIIPQKVKGQKVFLKNDGRMYIINEGIKTALTKNVILSNETIITTLGEVRNPDGSTVILENGQYVDQKGEIGKWEQ